MNKKIKRAVVICFTLMVLLTGRVNAQTEVFEQQAEAVGANEINDVLSKESLQYMPDLTVDSTLQLDSSLEAVFKNVLSDVEDFFTAGIKSASVLLAVVMFCSVGSNLCQSAELDKMGNFMSVVAALAVTAVSVGNINALIGLGSSTIEEMNVFSKVLLPSLAAAAAASGAPTAAAAKQLAAVLFSDVLITVIEKLLLPAAYVYVVLCVADACLEHGKLQRIAVFLKKAVSWVLKGILAAFTGYITMTGIISGTADSLAVKATQSVASAVPVVGGVISDASETVLAGAAVLRNAIGIFGTVALVAICAAPCIRIAVQLLFFKLSAAVSSTIGADKTVNLIDNLGSAVALVLAMTASCALLMFISIITTISVVS